MCLFGHADPVGKEGYNKTLSGSRAKATYALLTRNLDMWEELFHDHSWGLSSTQKILMFLEAEELAKPTPPDAPPAPPVEVFAGPPDGKNTKEWKAAVERFQTEHQDELKVDGDAGKNTRRVLYRIYMDTICCRADAEATPFKVEPSAFLGQGADKKGKGDYQGCSEFNTVLLLSKAEEQEFKDTKDELGRNQANAPNRRVVMYFFPAGLTIDVKKWPCPTVDQGPAGCRLRFWSDHEERRKQDEELRREYKEKRDTFACRFYDRLARRSPCEAGFHEWIVQVLKPGPEPPIQREPAAGATFSAIIDGARLAQGMTDANGVLRVRARADVEDVLVTLRIPVPPPPEGDKAKGDGAGGAGGGGGGSSADKPAAPPPVALSMLRLRGGTLQELDSGIKELAVIQRLRNLGYGKVGLALWRSDPSVLPDAVLAFRRDHEMSDSSDPNDESFQAKLREIYGS
jgi:hypothetical protein